MKVPELFEALGQAGTKPDLEILLATALKSCGWKEPIITNGRASKYHLAAALIYTGAFDYLIPNGADRINEARLLISELHTAYLLATAPSPHNRKLLAILVNKGY
jgi:hypothetical protein